jgi:hypothetical protein
MSSLKILHPLMHLNLPVAGIWDRLSKTYQLNPNNIKPRLFSFSKDSPPRQESS